VRDLVNLSQSTVVTGPDAFCLSARDGSLPLHADHSLGPYLDDCRHLRGHELLVGGRPLRLLVADDIVGTVAIYELTNPNVALADGGELGMRLLAARAWWVPNGACVEAMLRASGLRVLERPGHEMWLCERV
jgi:hypothetical protein